MTGHLPRLLCSMTTQPACMTGGLLPWLHRPSALHACLQVVLSNDRSGELARGVQAAMEATRLHQVAETIKAVFAPNDAFLLIRLDTAVSTARCRVLELCTASHLPGMTIGTAHCGSHWGTHLGQPLSTDRGSCLQDEACLLIACRPSRGCE